ncbi:MAG: radical SAM family heme chaperone HemW [Oscillospiraceae bacterium]|nr:radical SAM family heme chaperone HemW [Oscillospiraceae bacterium]
MMEDSVVGLYLHIPFCAKKCPYCDFYSLPYRRSHMADYTAAVCRNLAALPKALTADSIYLGGGTPSLLPFDALQQILDTIRSHCSVEHAEITLEANPCTMTDDALQHWLHSGINRLSVGIQSFCDDELKQLGRNHTAEQSRQAILRAANIGFSNLSVDLMLGTPLQTAASLSESIATALSLPITHLSAYMLKIEDGTPFAENPPEIADSDTAAERYHQLRSAMLAAGFHHYEISNFAKPGFESRHNLKYWECKPYIGIGPGAHSCYGGKRYYAPRSLEQFCSSYHQPIVIDDTEPCSDGERLMLGLRLQKGICLQDYPHCSSILLRNAKPLQPRFVTIQDDTLSLTSDGWLVSNSVLGYLLNGILP